MLYNLHISIGFEWQARPVLKQAILNIWAPRLLHNEKKPEDQEPLQTIFIKNSTQTLLEKKGSNFQEKHKAQTAVLRWPFNFIL